MVTAHFDMQDRSEASFVLGIEIHCDRFRDILGLSQKDYIERILNEFNIKL